MVLLVRLQQSGTLDRWNATRMLGIILMIRSKRGLPTLERVSKPRRFWRYWGEFTLWTCRIAMVVMVGLLLLTLFSSFIRPTSAEPPSPRTLVAVPGLNPMIPLGWGLAAFIVALVMHEFAHGLQARAHGMRVRSFGLLLLGPLPLGAFAEPEQEELQKAPRHERQRLFAAGPGMNLQIAVLCMLLIGPIVGAMMPIQEGVHARGMVVEGPAEEAGISPFEIMTHVDDTKINGPNELRQLMDEEYAANDTAAITVYNVTTASSREVIVTFADRMEYYLAECSEDPACDHVAIEKNLEEMGVKSGQAFIGISGMAASDDGVARLSLPLFEGGSATERIVFTLIHPLELLIIPSPWMNNGRAVHPDQASMVIADTSLLGSILGTAGLMFVLNGLFWMVWTNLILGLFNLIPLVPFDGGHMFRDRLHDWMEHGRRLGQRVNAWNWHPIRSEELARGGVRVMGYLMAAALLIPLIMLYA